MKRITLLLTVLLAFTTATHALSTNQVSIIHKTLAATPNPELAAAVAKLIKNAAPANRAQVRAEALRHVARHHPAALEAVIASLPPGIEEHRPPVTPGNEHGNRPTVPPGQNNYGRP